MIDPAKHFAKEKDALYHINSAKLQGPLIVVDPTYKYRNVTAGLGKETYHKFLDVAQAFVKKPSRDFFVKQELDVTELKKIAEKKKATLFVLEIESNRQEGDIVGTKCLKFLDFFSEELQRQNQHVLHKEFVYSGKGHVAHGYVIVQENSEVVLKGPPTKMAEAATAFRKEHKRAYEKGGYLFATRKTNVQEIFTQSNRVKDEMGVFGKSITQL